MNDEKRQNLFFPSDLIGVTLLFLSWFLPWISDPYSRESFSPVRYVLRGVDFFSLTFWMQVPLAAFILVGALRRKSRLKWIPRLTGFLVILELLLLNFPAIDSETRIPVQIEIGSILSLLAAVLLILPKFSGEFVFKKKGMGSQIKPDATITYFGILLFLSYWLPWTRGYYSWFGRTLVDYFPGHFSNFYFPLLLVSSSLVLTVWSILNKKPRIPALICGLLVLFFFLYRVLLQGIAQTIYMASFGFYLAIMISCALLWKISGKKSWLDSARLRNLLRIDVILAAILGTDFLLIFTSFHSGFHRPKINPLFELFIFMVPLLAFLSIILAWLGKENDWVRRTTGALALLLLIFCGLVAVYFIPVLIFSVNGMLAVVSSLGLILIPIRGKRGYSL
jgi:hypothetical protein